MRSGEALSPAQRAVLQRSTDAAEDATGLRFRVHLGALEAGRATAEKLLADDGAAGAGTVLIAVDPGSRRMEIVTGAVAAARLDDRSCGLAALAMTSSFAAGDVVGGLRDGIRLLADHARSPLVKHLDTY